MKAFHSRTRNLLLISLLAAGSLFFLFFSFLPKYGPGSSLQNPVYSLQINEVCTINPGVLIEGSVVYEDYIELYNPTDEAVSLENLYLSDDRNDLTRGALPAVSMEPGSYYIIYACGSDAEASEDFFSLPFRLSGSETLFLSLCEEAEDGIVNISVIDSVSIPDVTAGAVYGRVSDSSKAQSFAELRPSPGLSNSTAALVLEEPVFSAESGFYEDEVILEISSSGDTPVYYTLDGSEPTQDSLLYTEALCLTNPGSAENIYSARTDITTAAYGYTVPDEPVDKAVIVRAAAIDADGNYSNTVTASYFIDFGEREGYEGAAVISLVADPADLFDEESGIYVLGSVYEEALENGEIPEDASTSTLINYTNYYLDGLDSERIAHLDLFDSAHLLSLTQECGIRIRGNESRNFPQKSFTLFSRKRYGTESFAPVFFDTGISYSDLILNTGRNLKKVFFFSLLEDRDVSTQRYTPCQVFLNGEYWGMYYLMEKYSPEYLEGHYGTNPDDALLIKATREVQDGDPEDISRFKALRNYLEQDMSDPELYEGLLEQMDMQSFIDWMCASIYICNTDSKPLGGNVFTWQSTVPADAEYNDGKWRWMLYDLDDSLGVGMDLSEGPAYTADSFVEHAVYASSGYLDDDPMPSLMGNESFREQFVLTFLDMANENFSAKRVLPLLEELEAQYTSWADKSFLRWNTSVTDTPYAEQFEELETFFANRFDYIVPCLAEHFSLTGELVTLSLSSNAPEGGTVTLNTLTPDLLEEDWEGKYYTDYPVSLTAEALEGYVFEGWEISGGVLVSGDASSEQIRVQLGDSGTAVRAVFSKQ